MVAPQENKPSPTRTRSVTILAWLHLLQSLGLIGFGIYFALTAGWGEKGSGIAYQYLPLAMFEDMLSAVITFTLGGLGAIIAIAMFRLHPFAWLAAIILQGLGLLAALYGYIRGHPNYVGMAVGIFLVFYLNQYEVREAFRSAGRSTLRHSGEDPAIDGLRRPGSVE